LIDAR
jgi:hypothetical protein